MSIVGDKMVAGTHELEDIGRKGKFRFMLLAKQLRNRGQRSIAIPLDEYAIVNR